MKKRVIQLLVNIFSFIVRKKIKVGNGIIKANLGCGMTVQDGWYNIDASPTALLGSKKFTVINKLLYNVSGTSVYYDFNRYNYIIKEIGLNFYDLRRGIPFENNSIDVIYHSHFLEHLFKEDGEIFLKECYRVLKNGGLMRVVVPDLDVVLEMFKNNDKEKILESYFFVPYKYIFSGHKYMYNFEVLKNKLTRIGFREIIKCDYSCGDCPDASFLDVGTIESLYVECRK